MANVKFTVDESGWHLKGEGANEQEGGAPPVRRVNCEMSEGRGSAAS